MRRLLAACLLLMALGTAPAVAGPPLRNYTKSAHRMGSHFDFTVVAASDTLGWRAPERGPGRNRPHR